MLTDIVAGTCGGLAVVLVGHPFDTTKTRMQTAPNKFYSGTIDCVRKTYQWEGLRGFYAGICSPLAGQMFFRGCSFSTFYFALKANTRNFYETGKLSYNQMLLLSGAMTGFAISFVEAPIDLVKTKLQVQIFQNKLNPLFKPQYYTCRDCTSYLIRHFGLKSMYQGLSATMIRNVPANAMFFPVNEIAKKQLAERKGIACSQLSLADKFVAGACGGICYWLATFPFDVIKAKMQSIEYHQARTWRDTASHIYAHNGIRGFYVGIAPCIIRATFACGVMFTVVDVVREQLPQGLSQLEVADTIKIPLQHRSTT